MKSTMKVRIENRYIFYVQTDLDELIDVSDTSLMTDYVKGDLIPPTLDILLDWRSRLTFLLKKNTGIYEGLIKNEINAVDFLLNEHYN